MKTFNQFAGILIGFCALCTRPVIAPSGDQILDGIGETGLTARYVFKGDVKSNQIK